MNPNITYIKRDLEVTLKKYLNKHKVIVFYGARQVGKTTLAKNLFSNKENVLYLSCEQSRIREQVMPDALTLGRVVGDYKNIIFDDHAPKETELIYPKADLLLAPIRIGGGTSFKILEAMASGVPVITTALGNAIGAKEELEIVIAKNTEDFVVKIKKVLDEKEFHETISRNARKLIEENIAFKDFPKSFLKSFPDRASVQGKDGKERP